MYSSLRLLVPKLTQLTTDMFELNVVADRYASTVYFTGPICSSPLDKLLSIGKLGFDGSYSVDSELTTE